MLTRDTMETLLSFTEFPFFAIEQGDSLFIFNWVFGFCVKKQHIQLCPELNELEAAADFMASNSRAYSDIIWHIYKRGWTGILLGCGTMDLAWESIPRKEEYAAVSEYGLRVFSSSHSHIRNGVKSEYLQIYRSVFEGETDTYVFSSVKTKNYRPLVLFENKEENPTAIIHTVKMNRHRTRKLEMRSPI